MIAAPVKWGRMWEARQVSALMEWVRAEPLQLATDEELEGAARAFGGATAHGLDPFHIAHSCLLTPQARTAPLTSSG